MKISGMFILILVVIKSKISTGVWTRKRAARQYSYAHCGRQTFKYLIKLLCILQCANYIYTTGNNNSWLNNSLTI